MREDKITKGHCGAQDFLSPKLRVKGDVFWLALHNFIDQNASLHPYAATLVIGNLEAPGLNFEAISIHSPGASMARFLNTSGTTFFLEELIKNTHGRLVLVSPYLRINPRLRQLLEDADGMEVEIDVVYGKSELRPEEEAWLASLQNAQISYCENLHAKCYLNETSAIVTSMNLYDFSQVNNNEMGILVDRHGDTECFVEVEKEAQRIVRIAKIVKPRVERQPMVLEAAEPVQSTQKPEAIYQKLTTAALAKVCGVKTTQLLDYFTAKGYLEFHNGKHILTERGKAKEAEYRVGKGGVYFLWPKTLLKQFQEASA